MNSTNKLWTLLVTLFLACSTFVHATTLKLPTRDMVGPEAMPDTIAPITAPFEMSTPTLPHIPNKTFSCKLSKKGLQTQKIQAAIDRATEAGGGTVILPSGVWTTGRIILRSHVNLHLSEGCELHFSGDIKEYLPAVLTRDEGIDIYSLGACVYANGETDIALTGKGKIVGPSTDCEIYRTNSEKTRNIEIVVGNKPIEERIYDGSINPEVFLPKTFAPINCQNVLIESVTLEQGLFWNVVPQYCQNVIIRGVTVHSHGHGRTDGIDIDSSTDCLIEYCSLDCQDDCYTFKSGRGMDGVLKNRPTERVVVRYCLALRGVGGFVCGSETAGGMSDIYMHDCVFDGTERGFRFKTRRPRGGKSRNIFIERVRAKLLRDAVVSDMLGSVEWMGELAARTFDRPVDILTPEFRDITIHNVLIEQCRDMVRIDGIPESPLQNLYFGQSVVRCNRLGHIRDARNIYLDELDIITPDSVLILDNAPRTTISKVRDLSSQQPLEVQYEGYPSPYLIEIH